MSIDTYFVLLDVMVLAVAIYAVCAFLSAGRRAKGKDGNKAAADLQAQRTADRARWAAVAEKAAAAERVKATAAAWEAHAESLRLEVAEMERIARGEDADTDEWNERDDLAARVARLQPQEDGCPF